MYKTRNLVFWLLSVFGIYLTIHGFQRAWSESSQFFEIRNHTPALWIFVAGLVSIEAISRLANINKVAVSLVAGAVLALITGAAWPMIVTLWFFVSSYALGLILLNIISSEGESIDVLFIILLGAGCYGTVIGLIAHFPMNYSGIYGLMLAAPIFFKWNIVRKKLISALPLLTRKGHDCFLDSLIVTVGLIYFVVALMPEVGFDALTMHTFILGHLSQNHRWNFDAGYYAWAVMPMLGEWVFASGYMLAGEVAARLISVGFIYLLAWMLRELVLCGRGSEKGARWAVLFFLTMPLTYSEGSSLYIESVWAAFVVASSIAMFKVIDSSQHRKVYLIVLSCMSGFALAAKAVSFPVLPGVVVVLVASYKLWFDKRLVVILIACAVLGAALGAIPYFNAWVLTGNPVFPLFNGIFKSPYWYPMNFTADFYGKGVKWNTLYRATFYSGKYLESGMGAPGFQWLLLIFPSLAVLVFTKSVRAMGYIFLAIVAIFLVFHSTAYLRYVFPAFIWAGAGLGVALSNSLQFDVRGAKKIVLFLSSCALCLNLAFFANSTAYGNINPQALFSTVGREHYLEDRLPIRDAVIVVNNLNLSNQPVAVLADPLASGLRADALYADWYNFRFEQAYMNVKTDSDLAELLVNHNVHYVIFDENRDVFGKGNLVRDVTEKIIDYNGLSVREVKPDFEFKSELLKNSNFSRSGDWMLSGDAKIFPGIGVSVTQNFQASQLVAVQSGKRYIYSGTTFCPQTPTQARLQINWVDRNSKFLGTSIKVVKCMNSAQKDEMEVVAPENSAFAIVYLVGITDDPVIFRQTSFK